MALIKLSKKAYEHNLKCIAKKAGGFDKLICVFKNNAYGHGIKLLAPLAKNLGVEFIALKNEREALELESSFGASFFKNILILSHHPKGDEKPHLSYALNDEKDISNFKKASKIHLVIDTGMHRNGILPQNFEAVYKKAKKHGLKIEGIFTHFARSDEYDSSYFTQKKHFESVKERAKKLDSSLIFHSHNSSALFRCETFPEDEFARVGLAQFGYGEFTSNLQKVLSLYAHRLSQRILAKNECVGYGGAFCADKDIKIATYDLGYADGLFRFNGRGKLALENGKALLGKMSMDSFSCEDFGEELCVFKDARAWAEFFHTIEYEILSKLSPYIPRILID